MKRSIEGTYRVFVALLLATINLSAQNGSTFRNTSLDVVTNMESIALGESFVANPHSPASFFENPAALPDDKGTRLFYNYRSQGWASLTDNMKFFSLGITTGNSLGNFGFSYNQYSSGDLAMVVEPVKQSTNDVNRTFILSYSTNSFAGFSAGIGLKLFNRSLTASGFEYNIKSNNAFLADFGILYGTKGFLNNLNAKDYLSIGASIQNFGSDFTIETTFNSTTKENIRLPRYLRFGFAYTLNTIVGKRTSANLDLMLTGEYKNLLNPTEEEKYDVDYWGAGIEATLFKIISFRLGGVSSPEYNILFDRAKFNLRYGIGMNFPLAIIGLGYPMFIKFDYASIPINHLDFEGAKNSLYAFGVSIIYNPKM